MAEMTEVAARKYGRLIEAMDTLYANSTGAQKEWIDNNWKSILDGMVERGEEMIQGWEGEVVMIFVRFPFEPETESKAIFAIIDPFLIFALALITPHLPVPHLL